MSSKVEVDVDCRCSARLMADPVSQGDPSINSDNGDRQTSAFGNAAEILCSSLDAPVAGRETCSTSMSDTSVRYAKLSRMLMIWFIRARARASSGWRLGQESLVYIAGNRAGLVQAEAGMLEGGNFTEGVPRTLCSGGMPSGTEISTGIG